MLIGIYTNTFTSYFRYSYIAFYISSLICFLMLNINCENFKKVMLILSTKYKKEHEFK